MICFACEYSHRNAPETASLRSAARVLNEGEESK